MCGEKTDGEALTGVEGPEGVGGWDEGGVEAGGGGGGKTEGLHHHWECSDKKPNSRHFSSCGYFFLSRLSMQGQNSPC